MLLIGRTLSHDVPERQSKVFILGQHFELIHLFQTIFHTFRRHKTSSSAAPTCECLLHLCTFAVQFAPPQRRRRSADRKVDSRLQKKFSFPFLFMFEIDA